MDAKEFVKYLDAFLVTDAIEDVSLNGEVVERRGDVGKVALSVDTSVAAIEKAVEENADFLIVHHGIYWGRPLPLNGNIYDRIKLLIEHNIGLYVSHLPLDVNENVGNNCYALSLLGWTSHVPFGDYHGIKIARKFDFDIPKSMKQILEELSQKIARPAVVWNFGPTSVNSGVYCSGDCLSIFDEIKRADIKLFITGETRHSHYFEALETRTNIVFLGHYNSERIGLLGLARHIKSELGIEFVFIEEPTGL